MMAVVEPQGPDHWFEELADHMGAAYLRYSFPKGTVKEVDELLRRVPLEPGAKCNEQGRAVAAEPDAAHLGAGRRGARLFGFELSGFDAGAPRAGQRARHARALRV